MTSVVVACLSVKIGIDMGLHELPGMRFTVSGFTVILSLMTVQLLLGHAGTVGGYG